MIQAQTFLHAAAARGLDFYSGVPCSYLAPMINRVINAGRDGALDYVGAASEGEAVAIAAGAWLGGRGGVVVCQNSGLGNCVNPLTSLNAPFRIPLLLIATWRGRPGHPDEPQHELMGRITQSLLTLCGVPNAPFPRHDADIAQALDAAVARHEADGLPYALVMEEDSVAAEALREAPRPVPRPGERVDLRVGATPRPARAALLERMLALVPDRTAIVATTGKTGRELFTLSDRRQHLYQVGSMGGASGMALGVALSCPDRPVLVLDGDGAALMKLGTLATIGARGPSRLIHVLLDNGVHDSTGGQATVSGSVDFAAVAVACGYRAGFAVDDPAGFEEALAIALRGDGPILIHARIRPGSMPTLGRPTVAPHEVARRFRSFLAEPLPG